MKYIKENSAMGQFNSRDHMRGLPYYGAKGDFNFVTGRSRFSPGISIKNLPLSDMSRNTDVGISGFRTNVNNINKTYRRGDRVRGILVNSQVDSDNGKTILGLLKTIIVDERNHTIKIYINDPTTNDEREIYVDTMERIFESSHLAMSFIQYIKS